MSDTTVAPEANAEEQTHAEISDAEWEASAGQVHAEPEQNDNPPAAADEAEETQPVSRRSRGLLETDVKAVTDAFVTGEISLEEGKALTPHRIATLIRERDNLEKAPSTGAVSDCLKRWRELGFADVNEKPFSFNGYTQAGLEQGLKALKQARSNALKSERAAAKAASADATVVDVPAEATSETDVPV